MSVNATDVASRGLDIPNVDLVIQIEPPKETETYIHRSGRTARAGQKGTSYCLITDPELPYLHDLSVFVSKTGPAEVSRSQGFSQESRFGLQGQVNEEVIVFTMVL